MDILNTVSLESNTQIKINFDGGDLSSDAGLLLFKEILFKIGAEVIYSIRKPEFMLFDIDSTLLDAYGNQGGEGFNYHYQAHGYHPLLCYDGLTGDF